MEWITDLDVKGIVAILGVAGTITAAVIAFLQRMRAALSDLASDIMSEEIEEAHATIELKKKIEKRSIAAGPKVRDLVRSKAVRAEAISKDKNGG